MTLREELNQFEPKCLHGLGLPIESWDFALGAWIVSGTRRYLDFTSGGLMVANTGHGDRVSSLNMYGRISTYYTPTLARLRAYKAMQSILPSYLNRYVMTVTGGEAVETAIRIAADYLICSPYDTLRAYGPTYHGNHYLLSQLQENLEDKAATADAVLKFRGPCVILLCPYEGPTCRWWSRDFIDVIKDHQYRGSVVIFDEVQAGFGRTGTWWGFQHYDIEPDIICAGKGAAGGLPLSFIAGKADILDSVRGDYTSTHSANHLALDALDENIRYIKAEGLLENTAQCEAIIEEWATDHEYALRGSGLAQAVLVGETAKQIIDRCLQDNLLLMDTSAHGTIKIAPPLCIKHEDLRQGLDIISMAISAVGGN